MRWQNSQFISTTVDGKGRGNSPTVRWQRSQFISTTVDGKGRRNSPAETVPAD